MKFTFFLGYPGQTRQKAAGLPIRRNAKRPRGFPAGAIPTVDFLLHDFDRVVKKPRVKSHDRLIPPGHHWLATPCRHPGPCTHEIEALGSGALHVPMRLIAARKRTSREVREGPKRRHSPARDPYYVSPALAGGRGDLPVRDQLPIGNRATTGMVQRIWISLDVLLGVIREKDAGALPPSSDGLRSKTAVLSLNRGPIHARHARRRCPLWARAALSRDSSTVRPVVAAMRSQAGLGQRRDAATARVVWKGPGDRSSCVFWYGCVAPRRAAWACVCGFHARARRMRGLGVECSPL